MNPALTLGTKADASCVCASNVPQMTNAAEAAVIFFCPYAQDSNRAFASCERATTNRQFCRL